MRLARRFVCLGVILAVFHQLGLDPPLANVAEDGGPEEQGQQVEAQLPEPEPISVPVIDFFPSHPASELALMSRRWRVYPSAPKGTDAMCLQQIRIAMAAGG